MRRDRLEEAVLGEGFGQVFIRADHASTCPVEESILGREHDHRRRGELWILFDQGACLIAVKARHQDVAEHDVRLMIVDFRQRVEAVLCQDYLSTGLQKENFSGFADGVRIVDHHYLDAGKTGHFAHITPRSIQLFLARAGDVTCSAGDFHILPTFAPPPASFAYFFVEAGRR